MSPLLSLATRHTRYITVKATRKVQPFAEIKKAKRGYIQQLP